MQLGLECLAKIHFKRLPGKPSPDTRPTPNIFLANYPNRLPFRSTGKINVNPTPIEASIETAKSP